jgi:hypothetical protein
LTASTLIGANTGTFAMKKLLIRSFVIGSIIVTGALPASADLAPAEPRPAAQVEMAESGATTTDRATYAEKAHAEVQEWRVKLDQFVESAKTRSKEARKTASDDLNKAWTKTKDAAARLETAGTADWEIAKASFQNASDELAAKWAKLRAEKK